MISDYIVAVCLSETDFAHELADEWIDSDKDLFVSAGYSTYSWMISRRPDTDFDTEKLRKKLYDIRDTINTASNRTRYSMYYFICNVGISYSALHDEALELAKNIGDVAIENPNSSLADKQVSMYNAYKAIMKAVEKNRIGFKRKYVRC